MIYGNTINFGESSTAHIIELLKRFHLYDDKNKTTN